MWFHHSRALRPSAEYIAVKSQKYTAMVTHHLQFKGPTEGFCVENGRKIFQKNEKNLKIYFCFLLHKITGNDYFDMKKKFGRLLNVFVDFTN